MSYHQITSGERYMISALRRQGLNQSDIARHLGRHRSTISREFKRNCARYDGAYRPSIAIERTSGRRSRSRRNRQFADEHWRLVVRLLRQQWSPEQISGVYDSTTSCGLATKPSTATSGPTSNKEAPSTNTCVAPASNAANVTEATTGRGRIAGKRHISQRPLSADNRSRIGHWEIDTVMGHGSQHCIVSLVERKTGYTLIGRLNARTKHQTNRRTIQLINQQPELFSTITADNGTEFHDYKDIEHATAVTFYFATPHHSWERGTNENTNGLIRQYLPKRTSMAKLTQHQCNSISAKLNTRPRKRHGFKTPRECLFGF